MVLTSQLAEFLGRSWMRPKDAEKTGHQLETAFRAEPKAKAAGNKSGALELVGLKSAQLILPGQLAEFLP